MRFLYFPPFLLALSLVLAGIVHRCMDRTTRPPFAILELRWFLGVLFVFSGLAKLIPGFPNTMGPPDLEATLAPHGLALYARFIAASELGVGVMLLSRRFATLGALVLAPMLANILIITISLHWRGTPYLVSVFLVMDLVLLVYDRSRFWPLILGGVATSPAPAEPAVGSHVGWLILLAALLLVLGCVRVGRENTTGMLIVAMLVFGLAILDWLEAHRNAESRRHVT